MPFDISVGRDTAHASAVTRLADAREGYDGLVEFAAAASATPVEDEAADLRDAGRARVAASEAWLDWIDNGVGGWRWAMAQDESDARARAGILRLAAAAPDVPAERWSGENGGSGPDAGALLGVRIRKG